MIEKLLMKLRARDEVSPDEERALRHAIAETTTVAADRTIIRASEDLNQCVLLIDGMLCRYKDLRNGRRQISALHVPGDFLDLHGFTLKRLDHDVMALGPSLVAYASWSIALSRLSAARASNYLYCVPPVATLIGFLWLGEVPGTLGLIGGALALGGVAIVNLKR